jgi:hypothetical protein
MEKRLNGLKESRNGLSEYTVTLEEKIKKYEDDKSTNSDGIMKKDLFSRANFKDVEDYFLKQINQDYNYAE